MGLKNVPKVILWIVVLWSLFVIFLSLYYIGPLMAGRIALSEAFFVVFLVVVIDRIMMYDRWPRETQEKHKKEYREDCTFYILEMLSVVIITFHLVIIWGG